LFFLQVHLRISFSGPPIGDDIEAGDAEPVPEGSEELPPNELQVTVIQAKKLTAMDKSIFGGAGSSDPQVRIKIAGYETKYTKYIPKNLNPIWNQKLVWQAIDNQSLSLDVKCEDHNDLRTAAFIGKVALPLYEFADKQPKRKWYKLLNKECENDGVERGEVELLIHWKYTVESAEIIQKKASKSEKNIFNKLGKGLGDVGKFVGAVANSDSEASEVRK
jgi:Ca2+-dependent lipid-binding protein